MTISSLTYLILGLARSGKATVNFLTHLGVSTILYDDHLKEYNGQVVLSNENDIPWDMVHCVIQSPGIPFSYPKPHPVTAMALSKGIPIQTDIDLFNQFRDPKVACVGITGTNGKSTTTALITHILNASGKKALMGGNIGVSALSLLNGTSENASADVYVLELSSYQLETTQHIDLDVAALINVSEDHIERHGSMANYIAAKKRIFAHAKTHIYGENCPIPDCDLTHVERLPGDHNLENMKIAYAVCVVLGVPHDSIIAGIHSFPGLSHRMERVYTCSDFSIVNDSKATNADSTERAFAYYAELQRPPMIYWIAGGKAKKGGIQSLSPYFSKLTKVYFIGDAQDEFMRTVNDVANAKACGTLDVAVSEAFADIRREARAHGHDPARHYMILFSPACASFDQFKDFEHRGDEFKRYALGHLSVKKDSK